MPGAKMTVYQDKEGFYWFASVNGLQRYDGKNFITYPYKYSGNVPVRGEWVASPVEDRQGNIWILNEEGINILNRTEGSFERLYVQETRDSLVSDIAGIFKDNQERIWILTSRNIYRFDYATRKPVFFMKAIKDGASGMFDPVYDSARNGLWVMQMDSFRRIMFIDLARKTMTCPVYRSADSLLGHLNPIACFYLDKTGHLWLANYLGDICEYDSYTKQGVSLRPPFGPNRQGTTSPNSAVQSIADDGHGTVWMGGDYYMGVVGYNKRQHSFSVLHQDNGSEFGLHFTEDVHCIYTDREGNIWVGTDLGFNIFNPARQQFHYLLPHPPDSLSQFSTDVTSIYQSRTGDIWIGTWGAGIFRYDSNFNFIRTYTHRKDDPSSLGEPLNKAWCFTEDSAGRLWIGCQYGMLSVLDPKLGKFENTRIPEFKGRTIMHIASDSNKNIWFGLFGYQIGRSAANAGKMTPVGRLNRQPLTQLSPITGLTAETRSDLWWGNGIDGFQQHPPSHGSVRNPASLPAHVSSLCAANDSLLVGTVAGKGIFVLNQANALTHFYNIAGGLAFHFIFGALMDGPNSLWIFADGGLSHLNLNTGAISIPTLAEGIRDRELEGPYCRLRNGTILFAAKTGVIYFNPQTIRNKPPPPDVRITGVRAGEYPIPADSLGPNTPLSLTAGQNRLTIDYASLSFEGRKTDQYYYQLEGIDRNWIAAGTGRTVTYANLSPGWYLFKVKSRNADGIGTNHLTTLTVHIYPPWWKTWWAYALYLLSTAFIIYTVIDYRRRNRSHLSAVRQKIAADLHDDIGSTLNSISVYSEVAALQFEANPANAKQLLHKMGGASRQMIETMNDIVWAINPLNDQFENVILRMQYFAGELLSGKDILLQFDVDTAAKNIKLTMEKRKNIYLIFKEAVNNAFKYSHAKMVSLSIAVRSNCLLMTISDDGAGFDPSGATGQGNGLNNMKLRAREIHAQIEIISRSREGTKIELKIPLK